MAAVGVDTQVVLLDDATGVLHRLEPLGAIVWSCFDGSGTLDEIIDDLSVEFGAERAQVSTDVLSLVGELGELGLIDGLVAPWEEPSTAEPVETQVNITPAEPYFLVEPPSS